MRRKSEGKGQRLTKLVVFYWVLITFLLVAAYSYASDYYITDIEVLDNAVAVKINGPIKYRVSGTSDPFRVFVDIEGVRLGSFNDKIHSRRSGITEITLSHTETPIVMSRLDILLQAPSVIKAEVKDDILILYVKSPAETLGDIKKPLVNTVSLQEGKANVKNSAKEIIAVLFDKTDIGIELVIKGDGVLPDPSVFELDGKIMIDIPYVTMMASLPSSMLFPVKDIKHKSEKDKVRFIVDIEGRVIPEVFALDDEIVLDFDFKDKKTDTAKKEDIQKTQDSKPKTPNSNLVSLDFQDANVVPILRLIGDVSGYNIVVHPDVKGKITMKLLNVPWEQALEIILKTFGLEKLVEGNVIRIVTLDAIQKEKDAVAKTKEATGKAENVETKVYVVNYAIADKVKDSIEKAKVLSPRGSIGVDMRTRSLIVKDIISAQNEIRNLISAIDQPTPQVLIEARMVEVSSNFTKDLGIQWGVAGNDGIFSFGGVRNPVTDITKYTTTEPATQVGTGQATAGVTTSTNLLPLVVNLPAAVTSGSGAAIGLGYINKNKTLMLDFRLSALEATGKGKIISNPKIMTIENQEAVIRHGARIPIVTPGTTQGTFTTTYIDANLKLAVTPQVAPDGTVLMKVEVNKDEPDFSKTVQGNPQITTRSATTQVLLKDGETIVIGGILKTNETEGESGVPGLSRIPILGWLFKRETKTATTEELLIFITPRIVKQQ